MTTVLPTSVPAHDDLGAGPPVVLLHPSGFGPGAVAPFARRLAGYRRVVVPHRRGFGAAATLAPPAHLDEIHDEVADLIGHLGLQRPLVVGISAGATLALGFTLRHPGVAGAVVAHEPIIGPMGGSLHPRLVGRIARLLSRGDRAGETALFMRALVGVSGWEALTPELRRAVDRHAVATRHEASLFAGFALDERQVAVLADLPVTATVGTASPGARHEVTAALDRRGVATARVAGAGHLPVVESPAAFAALLDEVGPAGDRATVPARRPEARIDRSAKREPMP